MRLNRVSFVSLLGVALLVLFALNGCGSNISHISAAPSAVEKQASYNASLDKVWGAAQRALSEDDTVKVLDKSSGIMVTEFRTIDAKELSLAQTYFLGKTYKHSYTVNFIPASSARTDVRVNVKLQAVQLVLLSREESNEAVEGYLRKRLFDKIAAQLGQGTALAPEAQTPPAAAAAAPRPMEGSRPVQEPTTSRAVTVPDAEPAVNTKEAIARAQVRLKELGFDPGGADGVLGPRSIAAIRKYQTAKKLPVTGRLTPETLNSLGVLAP